MKRALTTVMIIIVAALSVTGCVSANKQRTSNAGNTSPIEEESQQLSDTSQEDKSMAKKTPVGITADSPEEYLEKFIRTYYIDKTEDVSTIWDNCVSEKTKSIGFISEQDYVNHVKRQLFDNELTDVLVISEGEVQENIYKLNATYKLFQSSFDNPMEEEWYIIDEDGEYRLLYNVVMDVINYSSEGHEEDNFELKDLTAFIMTNGISFTYELVNHSDYTVYMGPWASTVTIYLTMDDGQVYSTSYGHMIRITPNNSDLEDPFFEGASGIPAELTFDTITYQGADGLPTGETSFTVDLN